MRQFVSERFGISRGSSCLNWLYRLGFACKRPKKRLLKANESQREAFVAEYAALWEEAQRTEASIFFADEAHFRADAELRGKWVLKGKPALVDSNSPRLGRRPATIQRCASRWNGWNWRATATAGSDATEGKASRAAAGHLGQWPTAVREYLRTPELELRLVNLRATARTSTPMRLSGAGRERRPLAICAWGASAGEGRQILAGLSSRKDEVRRRCRTVLQSRAETLPRDSRPDSQHPANAHPTLALV